jgi:hypothetical protein
VSQAIEPSTRLEAFCRIFSEPMSKVGLQFEIQRPYASHCAISGMLCPDSGIFVVKAAGHRSENSVPFRAISEPASALELVRSAAWIITRALRRDGVGLDGRDVNPLAALAPANPHGAVRPVYSGTSIRVGPPLAKPACSAFANSGSEAIRVAGTPMPFASCTQSRSGRPISNIPRARFPGLPTPK